MLIAEERLRESAQGNKWGSCLTQAKFSLALWLALTPAAAQFTDSDSNTVTVTVASAAAAAYYFAANGLDTNPCTRMAPCQTVAKIASLSIKPGSTINFRGGDNFTGCWVLTPTNVPGGGDKNNPIIVQSYGTGRATLTSNCTGNFVPQLDIAGVSGITVQNLKFQGDGATTYVGILVEGPGDTIIIQNNEITGFVFNNVTPNWGSEIGIVGLGSHLGAGCNALNNIQVLNNNLHGASVTSKDSNGIYGFGCGRNVTNVHYAGNHVWNMGGGGSSNGAFSPNGIVANGVTGGTIEHNLIHDVGANQGTCGGPTGIMTFNAANITIQFNEVYNIQPVPDLGLGCDFAGYDIDGGGTVNVMVQYNYSHDNAGPAYMNCCGAGGGHIIRYNISENDNKLRGGAVIRVGQPGVDIQVYNNTVWIPYNNSQSLDRNCINLGFGGATTPNVLIANNACYNSGGSPRAEWNVDTLTEDPTRLNINHNLYLGPHGWRWQGVIYHTVPDMNALRKEIGSLIADPMFVAPGRGGKCGLSVLTTGPQPCPSAYQLKSGSPALGAGAVIPNDGERDYYGNPTTRHNIGADQGAH